MLDFAKMPEVQAGDLAVGSCELRCARIGTASTFADAWALLPSEGRGVVVLADRVVAFEESPREGRIIEAEVVGADGTTLLRMDGGTWTAWRWTEGPGTTHRYIERRFRSSRPAPGGHPPHFVYRQYWTRCPETGSSPEVAVWQPLGACLVGFEEESR